MAGSKNDVVVGKNADFSQAGAPNATTSEANGLATNGQLWIGTTALNAGGTHVNVGLLTSPNGSITFGYSSPNITAQVTGGSTVGQTITGDTGGALSPTAGNWNILGQQSGTIPVVDTIGTAPSTLRVEDRTWNTSLVVDPSATVGLRGTFQTITAALAAAVSGQDIFIRPGTYTENLTLKAGVNLTSFLCDSSPSNNAGVSSTIIIGKLTCTYSGTVGISGLELRTNSDFCIESTGANEAYLNVFKCNINALNNTAINGTNANFRPKFTECTGNLGTTGIALFTFSTAALPNFNNCNFTNIGNSATASTIAGGQLQMNNTRFESFSITTSSTATLRLYNCVFENSNLIAITHGGGDSFCYGCTFASGTASAVSVGSGSTLRLVDCQITSTNTNAVTGLGQVRYSGLVFPDASSLINTTTQVPNVRSNDAVTIVTPGAYPYTTIPQDAVILVDSSSARTIVPLASPSTGQ